MLLNLRLIASTFLIVFLAELGDKTQLSVFALAANRKGFLSVFVGAAGALLLATVIAAALGAVLGRLVPERAIKIVAAVVFISVGVLTLYEAFKA
jgi:putative Ca2+/H+ antiporter (TMEM165/GDT1 family)